MASALPGWRLFARIASTIGLPVFFRLSPTKPKAGSSTGRWTEPGFQGPPAWTGLARSEPLRAALLSSFLINLGRKAQLSERSFARSALFHWFRALRAYPRSATCSLDTTSLWFPEWRCFHIEPPCKYAAPLVEQFGQGTENASTQVKYWTQTKFGRSVILLDQIVEGLSRSHWPMICRAARCEGVMARQPALALARPRRRPTKISMRAVRTRA